MKIDKIFQNFWGLGRDFLIWALGPQNTKLAINTVWLRFIEYSSTRYPVEQSMPTINILGFIFFTSFVSKINHIYIFISNIYIHNDSDLPTDATIMI